MVDALFNNKKLSLFIYPKTLVDRVYSSFTPIESLLSLPPPIQLSYTTLDIKSYLLVGISAFVAHVLVNGGRPLRFFDYVIVVF